MLARPSLRGLCVPAYLLLSLPAWGTVELKSLVFRQQGTEVQLHLKMTAAVEPREPFLLEKPYRLVLDLPATELKRKLGKVKVPTDSLSWVQGVRIGRHKDRLRLVLDLSEKLPFSLKKSGKKLVLSVMLPPRDPTPKPRQRAMVVVIDPGHGGRDSGTEPRGVKEKDVVLQISRRLYDLLLPLEGFAPYLTRNADGYLYKSERVAQARTLNADLFLSIHADFAPDKRARGASAYVLSRKGASSEAAKQRARRENTELVQEVKVGGIPMEEDKIFNAVIWDLAQTPTLNRSIAAGQAILKQMEHVSAIHNKRVGRANFVVLRLPHIPSVLVETGYLSSQKDAISLVNPRFQLRLARSILLGIVSYLRAHPYTDLAALGGFLKYRVRKGDTLSQVADNYGITVRRLKKTNGLTGSHVIYPGQLLKLPIGIR